MADAPGTMDTRIALEILIQRLRGNITDLVLFL